MKSLSSTDWSRSARTKRKLESTDSDATQTRITCYFEVINKISQIVKQNKFLSNLLQSPLADSAAKTSADTNSASVLNKLLTNIENNAQKHPKGRRHNEIIKKFATVLYTYAGSMAYDFLQKNMPEALPSLRTVQSLIQSQYSHIEEGCFRFDELLEHLKRFDSPHIVAVAEDATRIINKVEYDPATNKCVGFVLPQTSNGLPDIDAYLAVSFKGIEHMFQTASIAKYAYMYVVQPLKESTPSFCLASVGTNNKFTAKEVLQTWTYIYSKLKKRKVDVISFAADGDSRLMRAMRVTLPLLTEDPLTGMSLNKGLNCSGVPDLISHWLCTKLMPMVSCVQDTVHIGVKLKARFLKPSIVLPMGSYLATNAHFQMIVKLYGKEKHGLRARDIDHRDKQNFDAVGQLIKASYLLDELPDAVGTRCYINVMKSVVDSYLDKSLSPAKRIEEIWYAVFFLRYWRSGYFTILHSHSRKTSLLAMHSCALR